MSFSSLLNQVKHKSSSPDPVSRPSSSTVSKKPSTATSEPSALPINVIPKDYRRPTAVDPAVVRLKEARRLQQEKEATKKKKNHTRTTKSGGTPKAIASANLIRRKQQEKEQRMKELEAAVYRPRSQSPVKKLTYSELMAQAKQKGRALSSAPKSPPPKDVQRDKSSAYQSKSIILRKPQPPSSNTPMSSRGSQSPLRAPVARPPPSPKPMAKPSAQLQAKLLAKKKAKKDRLRGLQQRRGSYGQEEEEDEEEGYGSGDLSDDFIVHDEEEQGYEEEEEEGQGYDREEIWKMFNRGKSRRDYDRYDDDLSDMEATGADVEREEMLAAKRAREEDLREQERERRRQEEKRRRLGK